MSQRSFFVLLLFLATNLSIHASVKFDHAFSPQEGLTAAVEQPWRQEICLNGSWEFQPVALPAGYDIKNGTPLLPAPDANGWSTTPIRIPSPWNVNANSWGYSSKTFPSYPEEWEKARMGWLRRYFKVPAEWNGKRILLHFEAVAGSVQVLVNGEKVAEHFDNSLPFEADVTDFVKSGEDNTLLLGIREASLFNVSGQYGKLTYAAGPPWMMHTTGVWQDVFLRAVPPVRVADVIVRPWVDQGFLELIVAIRNDTAQTQTFHIGGEIKPWINQAGKDVISAAEPHWRLGDTVLAVNRVDGSVGPRRSVTLTLRQPIKNELSLWTADTPNLYGLVLDISQHDKPQDRLYQRFGWRQWSIRGRSVTRNGQPFEMRGEAAHVLGVADLSRRNAYEWYRALKMVGGNAVRLHAVVRPRFYLDLADEMGIAILDESEIWASAMDYNYESPDTWLRFGAHIDGIVERDRNHPSIFGWSISNEILSAIWWQGTPRKFWPPVIDKVVALADRVRALDPTRAWISSDGDGDFGGRLPVYSYHYGDPRDWVRNAPKDRPFEVGEAGSMVWGSPPVFSVYNGERSYESMDGMLEGTAIEFYDYLVQQRKLAAFSSIFTFEGTGLKRLPLGMADRDQLPTEDDGIVFGRFVEGRPGIQPERLPPYSTPFNPGFDPNLPEFEPTSVYEAVKAAYNPSSPLPNRWDHRVKSPELPSPPSPTIRKVAFAGDSTSNLREALDRIGISVDPKRTTKGLLVIDGASVTQAQLSGVQRQLQAVLKDHGTVFVWASPENLETLNSLLPLPVTLIPQDTSALLADRTAPETSSISLASLYFQDQSDKNIAKNVLGGPLVGKSRVLIESNNFGRRRGRPASSRLPVLIASDIAGGKLLVTSLLPDTRTDRRLKLMRNLFTNLGVALSAPNDALDKNIDGAGYVNKALVLGSFQGVEYPENLDHDYLGDEGHAKPKSGDHVGELIWKAESTFGDGIFDFFRIGIPGTEGSRVRSLGNSLRPEALDANGYLVEPERLTTHTPGIHSIAYLSFWLYAPQQAAASSSDSVKVSMLVTSDDGTKIWVNQLQVHEDRTICGPGMKNSYKIPLVLNAGWNHVLVKSAQLDGPWSVSAQLSANSTVMEELKVSAEPPTRP